MSEMPLDALVVDELGSLSSLQSALVGPCRGISVKTRRLRPVLVDST